jgi:hypothetical protein
MRARFAAAVVLAMLWSSVSAGQGPPTVSAADVAAFQGTWVADLERSGLAESSAERRVITNDATAMRVDVYRARDARPFTLVYKFDGSPNTTPFGDGTAVSTLRREGAGFLTETVYTVKERPVTVRELLPPAPNGSELAIDVMVRVEHGYQVVTPTLDSGAPNAAKAIKYFQKQP